MNELLVLVFAATFAGTFAIVAAALFGFALGRSTYAGQRRRILGVAYPAAVGTILWAATGPELALTSWTIAATAATFALGVVLGGGHR